MNNLTQLKKKKLRSKILTERSALDSGFRAGVSENILEKLKSLDFFEKKRVVHVYLPIKGNGEIFTWAIIDWLERSGHEVWSSYLPPEEVGVGFCKLSANTIYDVGRFGIPLPREEVVGRCHPGVVLVPCLAADRSGNRLGYGSGWYDKFLSEHKTAIRVGLVYDQFLFEEVPHDERDQQLDVVISDKFVLRLPRRK